VQLCADADPAWVGRRILPPYPNAGRAVVRASWHKRAMATILIVDDDPDVCGLLEACLRLEGFDVLTACDGSDALRQLRESSPALILLDLMMPVMDGVEFRRQQQDEPRLRDISVVCLSARHDAGQTAARHGRAGFVGRPVDLDTMMSAVRRLALASV
jgi:CheY-like chemotaxis protein